MAPSSSRSRSEAPHEDHRDYRHPRGQNQRPKPSASPAHPAGMPASSSKRPWGRVWQSSGPQSSSRNRPSRSNSSSGPKRLLPPLILAAELGKRGITVNAIGPGLTVTDFTAHARQDPNVVQQLSAHTALGRLGEAEDIAGVAAWLGSDDARWVTGQYIEASGGSGLV